MPRPHSLAAYNALKTATKLLLQDLGGVEAAATTTRVGKSQLSDYANTNQTVPAFVPADVLLDLEHVGGTPHVTAALARAQGYHLVPMRAQSEHELAVLMAHVAGGVGKSFEVFAEALADGVIDDREAHDLEAQISLVCTAGFNAMAWLRNKRGATP